MRMYVAVAITAANIDDAAAAPKALRELRRKDFPRLQLLWADQKYHNYALQDWLAEHAHFDIEVVSRPEGAKGFVLIPKRWVAERTIAWLKRCRRLSVDREKTTLSSVAMIHVAMIHLMLNRLNDDVDNSEFNYRMAA